MRLSARQLQHQQQVEQHAQQAPHQERHQWRCWPRQLRGAHGAFSRARRAHSFSLDVVSYLIGSRSESCHKHLHTIRGAPSLTRFSLSTSTCSSLSFPSTSCTPSCTLSSTTRSSWKACATPPTRRVRTPTTSPPPSQVKQLNFVTFGELNDTSVPFSFKVPSSDQDMDDVITRQAAHRGTPRTSRLLRTRRHVSQLVVVVVCCVRWNKETCGRKKCRSINWFWCHEIHVQCSQQVFWKHPSWESGR